MKNIKLKYFVIIAIGAFAFSCQTESATAVSDSQKNQENQEIIDGKDNKDIYKFATRTYFCEGRQLKDTTEIKVLFDKARLIDEFEVSKFNLGLTEESLNNFETIRKEKALKDATTERQSFGTATNGVCTGFVTHFVSNGTTYQRVAYLQGKFDFSGNLTFANNGGIFGTGNYTGSASGLWSSGFDNGGFHMYFLNPASPSIKVFFEYRQNGVLKIFTTIVGGGQKGDIYFRANSVNQPYSLSSARAY